MAGIEICGRRAEEQPCNGSAHGSAFSSLPLTLLARGEFEGRQNPGVFTHRRFPQRGDRAARATKNLGPWRRYGTDRLTESRVLFEQSAVLS
jgi:hypothetical protein